MTAIKKEICHWIKPMELSDFVTDSLIQISDGVVGANQKIERKGGEKSKAFALRPGSNLEAGSGISFDIAVTAQSNSSKKGDAKIKLAIFDSSAAINKGSLSETVSRIKFSVNVNQWSG